MEGQNDEHLEGLTAKVKLLKDVRAFVHVTHVMLTRLQITIGIGNEVRDSTIQLSQMVRLLSRTRPLHSL